MKLLGPNLVILLLFVLDLLIFKFLVRLLSHRYL